MAVECANGDGLNQAGGPSATNGTFEMTDISTLDYKPRIVHNIPQSDCVYLAAKSGVQYRAKHVRCLTCCAVYRVQTTKPQT